MGEQLLQRLHQGIHTLGVMATVNDEVGISASQLQPSRPLAVCQPTLDRLIRDLPSLLPQAPNNVQSGDRVIPLVFSQQRNTERTGIPIGEHLPVQSNRLYLQGIRGRHGEGDRQFSADALHHFFSFPALVIQHTAAAGLQDAGLLLRDQRHRIAQLLGVL